MIMKLSLVFPPQHTLKELLCIHMLFSMLCCVVYSHYTAITCMVASTFLPMTVCWSEPALDEWFSVWKQSHADLRSQSYCSVDKLETWLLLENNTDSTEYEHFVVMYFFLQKRKMWLPYKKVCCNDDNWWTWGMEFFGDASASDY